MDGSWSNHDDVIKWKHFPRYWPFVRGIHRSPLNSPHKGQWRGALMFSLIWVWIKGWVNNRGAGNLRRYRANYDVIVLWLAHWSPRWVVECVCGILALLVLSLVSSLWSNSLMIGIYLADSALTFVIGSIRNKSHLVEHHSHIQHFRKICNISRTKSPNLKFSRLILQLSLPNPLKPGVKSRMKI